MEEKYVSLTNLGIFKEELTEYIDRQDQAAVKSINYTNEDATTISIGGIEKGQSFKDKTYEEMFDALLYPYVAPDKMVVKREPSNLFYERGVNPTLTSVSASCVVGSKPITQALLFKGSNTTQAPTQTITDIVIKDGVASVTFSFDNYKVSEGEDSHFTVVMSDGKTSLRTETDKFYWVTPFYYGVGEEFTKENFTSFTKDVSNTEDKVYSFSSRGQKAIIAYPVSYGKLAKITDELDSIDYTAMFGNPATISLRYDKQGEQPNWGPVDYYVYTSEVFVADDYKLKFRF